MNEEKNIYQEQKQSNNNQNNYQNNNNQNNNNKRKKRLKNKIINKNLIMIHTISQLYKKIIGIC